MVGVLRSEANTSVLFLTYQLMTAGFCCAAALFFFSTVAPPYGAIYGGFFCVFTFVLGVRADRNFKIVKRFILQPPISHIISEIIVAPETES